MYCNRKILAAGLLVACGTAHATPEYTGPLLADFPNALDPSSSVAAIGSELNNGPGYYFFASSDTDFHLRWTADSRPAEQFYGSISVFSNGIASSSGFQFEAGDGAVNAIINGVGDDQDSVSSSLFSVAMYESGNTIAWDGLDIVLTEAFAVGDEMRLDLYSTAFEPAADPGDGADGGIAATNIWVGPDLATPDIEVVDPSAAFAAYGAVKGQAFEISKVPEPATVALIGLGLLGMSRSRKRR